MASFRPPATGAIGRGISRIRAASHHAVVTPLAGAERKAGRSAVVVWLSGALLLGGLAAGVLLSTSWGTEAAGSAATSPVTRQSGREIVASTIIRLETEQIDLKKRISDLREQVSTLQGDDAKRKTTLQGLNDEIARQRMASGLLALVGPGVVATYNDSVARSIPENEDPANYIIHEYDLRDILNSLWIAGAEAISLNGERIVGNTSLYCVGTTVICNATRLSPPYEIRAIGDPEALQAALQGAQQMEKFNQRAQIYDLPVTIERGSEVQVKGYNGSFVFKYATVEGDK